MGGGRAWRDWSRGQPRFVRSGGRETPLMGVGSTAWEGGGRRHDTPSCGGYASQWHRRFARTCSPFLTHAHPHNPRSCAHASLLYPRPSVHHGHVRQHAPALTHTHTPTHTHTHAHTTAYTAVMHLCRWPLQPPRRDRRGGAGGLLGVGRCGGARRCVEHRAHPRIRAGPRRIRHRYLPQRVPPVNAGGGGCQRRHLEWRAGVTDEVTT